MSAVKNQEEEGFLKLYIFISLYNITYFINN
jgi:hypothetical protein